MNRRFMFELAIVILIAIVFIWFLPCYMLCSVDQIYPLTVRVFGLTLMGVWILRTAKKGTWNESSEEEVKGIGEDEEVRIY